MLIIAPRKTPRLLKPDRTIVTPGSPGWDDLPIDRPRAGRRGGGCKLLSGRAGLTRLQPGSCCGCGSPPPPGQTCGTCSIPDSLFLTDSNGTISFDFDVTHGFWFGCYTLSESDIVTVVASTDIGLITCCQTGDSYIVVAYVGQCVTVGATHEFQVSLCYNTVAYDPTGASDFHCHNLNPPFGPGWFPVCCTSTNPCTGISAVCTYLGGGTCGPTQPAHDAGHLDGVVVRMYPDVHVEQHPRVHGRDVVRDLHIPPADIFCRGDQLVSCDNCPCPDICLAHPIFCEWAAAEHPDPVRIKHIRDRSARERRPDEFPSLAHQALSLAGAVGRVVAAVARGEPVKVPPAVYYERLAICRECEFNTERPAGVRCSKCGCGGMKLELATERCPLDTPKWPRWEKPDDGDRTGTGG